MFDLVWKSFFAWVNISVVVAIINLFFIFSKKYHWMEALIQIVATFLLMLLFVYIALSVSYEINHKEFWNGQVKQFNYYEEWTEEVQHSRSVYTTDSKGNSVYSHTEYWTTYDYRAPHWEMDTDFGGKYLNKKNYFKAVNKYGQMKILLNRSGQVSRGDGNKYLSKPTDNICLSKWNTYVNWIKASKFTIHKKQGLDYKLVSHEENLSEYPNMDNGEYGQPYFFRVINKSSIPTEQFNNFEKKLSEWSAINSGRKQINLMVYIVENASTDFVQALHYKWEGANKNDSIVILSVSGTKIKWSDTISFTKIGLYKVNLRMFGELDIIQDQDILANKILSNIEEHWVRLEMAEFIQLKEDLTLSIKSQMIIILLNLLLNLGLGIFFFFNNFGKGDVLN